MKSTYFFILFVSAIIILSIISDNSIKTENFSGYLALSDKYNFGSPGFLSPGIQSQNKRALYMKNNKKSNNNVLGSASDYESSNNLNNFTFPSCG